MIIGRKWLYAAMALTGGFFGGIAAMEFAPASLLPRAVNQNWSLDCRLGSAYSLLICACGTSAGAEGARRSDVDMAIDFPDLAGNLRGALHQIAAKVELSFENGSERRLLTRSCAW